VLVLVLELELELADGFLLIRLAVLRDMVPVWFAKFLIHNGLAATLFIFISYIYYFN
jgi:hypothetical protein